MNGRISNRGSGSGISDPTWRPTPCDSCLERRVSEYVDLPSLVDPYLSVMTRVDVNRLFHDAIKSPGLYAFYMNSLVEAADSAEVTQFTEGDEAPMGWLEREIRQAFDQIRDAALADANKPYANDEFLIEVDKLLEFARIRSGFVREEVSRIR